MANNIAKAHYGQKETFSTLLMTEEYWSNSQFSVARFYGGCTINGRHYMIVNKEGIDLFTLSMQAEGKGEKYAIPPGQPADLVADCLVPAYRKLGRDKIWQLIGEGKTVEEVNEIAGIKKNKKKK